MTECPEGQNIRRQNNQRDKTSVGTKRPQGKRKRPARKKVPFDQWEKKRPARKKVPAFQTLRPLHAILFFNNSTFYNPDVLSRRTFGRRTFCPAGCLSRQTFCPHGCFVRWTFCPTDVRSPDVFSPDVLSLRTFCRWTFCLGT